MASAEDLDLVRKIIGKRVEARRDQLKREGKSWSQEEIAESAQIDLKQFGRIENGKAEPRIKTLIQIAGALGISPAELIDGLTWTPGEGRGFGQMKHGGPQ